MRPIFLQTIPAAPIDTIDIQKSAAEFVETIVSTPADQLFSNLLEKALHFGINVLLALLIYFVGGWLIKRIRRLLEKFFEKRNTDKAIASFSLSLVSISLTVLLIVITVGTLGINTTSLAALLAAGGMAIGMALSGTVQNFAGGIMLLVFKPFRAGDFIEAQGFSGTVAEVNIVSTKLVTTDNRNIIIPNGILSNGTINNYSQNVMRRVEWLIDVEYGSSTEEAKKVLQSIIDSDERICRVADGAPADPLIELNALKESSVQLIMRVWVKTADYWDVFFLFNDKIYNELPKQGIRFPFRQLDVHISKD